MPDRRSHRGAHPEDARLFAPEAWPALRAAAGDLCWLLARGYAARSALALVGNRFALTERQRAAVLRSSCADAALQGRLARRAAASVARGRTLHIDGFNLLLTVEGALGRGLLLRGRDGCLRDLASVHGTYRSVAETRPAVLLVGEHAAALGAVACTWFLDRPVANSGRLRAIILETAAHRGWPWTVELADSPDAILRATEELVVTADAGVLDRCRTWLNLAHAVVERLVPEAWVVDLFPAADPHC